jgi:hypothetical protein
MSPHRHLTLSAERERYLCASGAKCAGAARGLLTFPFHDKAPLSLGRDGGAFALHIRYRIAANKMRNHAASILARNAVATQPKRSCYHAKH